VPGPQYPLYLVGAKVLAMYPQPPLLPNVGLSIGLVSYDGTLYWGFCADPERVPDLDYFVEKVSAAADALERAAVSAPARATPAKSATKKRRADSTSASA
jgi:diacylglycerol O-acyltransferase